MARRRLTYTLALQLTYPGTKISTLEELFIFANCADPKHKIQWNIESKINASHPNSTHSVETFVTKQYAEFAKSSYPFSQIIVSATQIALMLLPGPYWRSTRALTGGH